MFSKIPLKQLVMPVTFPKDITIYEDSLQCGNQKVSYDEIKSISVSAKETTTNLTALTGIPTHSDLASSISLFLDTGPYKTDYKNRIDIGVAFYEEWGPFKNKEGMEKFKDGLAFSKFLEEKTFKQRMDRYLKTGTHDMHFKYRTNVINVYRGPSTSTWTDEYKPELAEGTHFFKDYEFLKDKTIRSGGKIYASFNPEKWTVKRSLKKLSFWQTGIFGSLDTIFGRDERDVTSINLTYDEDVILHLINKLIGVSPKIDKS